MKTVAILLLIAVAGVSAECPNACSGHGDCGTKDECTCYPNWQAADCSERTCPFGLSFVDTPQGDLNHDGSISNANVAVQWSTSNQWEKYPNQGQYSATADEAHFYVECSNKGHCDRASGVCQCFDGYTGSSCQRTTCPNDCSGHGVCRTTGEIAAAAMNTHVVRRDADHSRVEGVESAFNYNLWDADKNQACVCDPGYTGPDCSMRECPRGDDPLSALAKDCGGATCRTETQQLVLDSGAAVSGTFTLGFQDWTGKSWTTADITLPSTATDVSSTVATNINTALLAIPNDVIESVTVTGTGAQDGGNAWYDLTISVQFTANPGNINQLTAVESIANFDITPSTTAAGNGEEVECSYRGLCDYETGLCSCFKGYWKDDCSMQSTLAL